MATTAQQSRRIDTKVWWYLGFAIDILHMPIVLGFIILGAKWFSGPVYVGLITVLVVLQVALMACPVMALTGWLKQKHDPSFENHWSLTYWLYREFGRAVGIGVFVFFLAAALIVRQFI